MALNADRTTRIRAQGAARHRTGDVAADAVIFKGGIIAKNAGGFIVAASDIAAIKVVGIAEESVDATGASNGDLTAAYVTGIDAELLNAGSAIVQAGKHAPCFVADDQSVTSAAVAANDVYAGFVAAFDAATVWVHIDEVDGYDGVGLVAPLDGADIDTVADATVSPASTVSGVPVIIPIAVPDHATQTLVYKTTEAIEIMDVQVIKAGAAAASTIQLTDGSDNAISDAIAAATDKACTRAGTLDPAYRSLAAGATFKLVATRATGTMAAEVLIHAVKRA